MDKVKIRKVSDWWGEYDCSSNRNMPKYIHWLSRDTQDPHTVSVYVDNYIKDVGFNDPSREKMVTKHHISCMASEVIWKGDVVIVK